MQLHRYIKCLCTKTKVCNLPVITVLLQALGSSSSLFSLPVSITGTLVSVSEIFLITLETFFVFLSVVLVTYTCFTGLGLTVQQWLEDHSNLDPLYTVPSASPLAVSITVSHEQNNTIHLSWGPPPHETHNGIIQGYQVITGEHFLTLRCSITS